VRAGPELAQSHAVTDVLILPEVDAIEIRDWKAFDPGVSAGYQAATEALDSLTHPVVDLRRRQSLDDAALAKRRSAPSGGGR
jgi:NTE family protein